MTSSLNLGVRERGIRGLLAKVQRNKEGLSGTPGWPPWSHGHPETLG